MNGSNSAKKETFSVQVSFSYFSLNHLIPERFIHEILLYFFFSITLCNSILFALTFLLQSMANSKFVLSGVLSFEM